MDTTAGAHRQGRRQASGFHAGSILLGFALGGFFDGILLHQVLQWHHLLSLVEGRGADLPFQIAADGYFHVSMYVLAAIGLACLWRSHRTVEDRGRLLLSNILIGFALWNVVDIVGVHWLIGIHRTRLDGPDPLLWDLIWLAAFGFLPPLPAWLLRRGRADRGGGSAAIGPAAASILVIAAGAWAARPPSDNPFTTVVFKPGTQSSAAVLAVAEIGGRPVWIDATGRVIVFENTEAADAATLYRQGAMLVGGGFVGGCLGWAQAAKPA